MNILNTLMDLGFTPTDASSGIDSFECEFRSHMVRVEMIDGATTIYVNQINNVNVWSQVLTNAPADIIISAIKVAVRDARNRPA